MNKADHKEVIEKSFREQEDDLDKVVGRNIRRLRRNCGMTQTELGDLIGIRFQQIQKYESGYNRMTAVRLFMLARAFDRPLEYFFKQRANGGLS